MGLTLAERDLHLLQIEKEIENKKKLLIKKKKDLEKTHKLNHHLSSVKNDYSKYYDSIFSEKYQQHEALTLLKEYMNELIESNDLVDEQLRIAKHDHKDIVKEIKKVKDEIDELSK